uniref:Cytochrome b-c1 complex subunit 8 n=1 Tax=Aegilops tauschii subsp. strangulata TaxID=200361 RepID=A0A453QWP4_AEGTS
PRSHPPPTPSLSLIGAGGEHPHRGRRRSGEARRKMGKMPVRMKAVVYALSPFQQQVMPGLWKDITTKIHHKVSENWISATLLITPVVGTYQYVPPPPPSPLPPPLTRAIHADAPGRADL